MTYEFKMFSQYCNSGGLKFALSKIGSYVSQFFRARQLQFSFDKWSDKDSAEEIVDWIITVKGGLLQPMQNRNEFVQLVKLVQQLNPKNVIEIGTAHGGTLAAWCAVSKYNASIISIDLPGGCFAGGYPWWKKSLFQRLTKPRQWLYLIRGDSHSNETFDNVIQCFNPEMVDFLFIDGDHTLTGVEQDYYKYASFVRKGGVIALHDILPQPNDVKCEVHKLWSKLKTLPNASEIICPDGMGIGIIKV